MWNRERRTFGPEVIPGAIRDLHMSEIDTQAGNHAKPLPSAGESAPASPEIETSRFRLLGVSWPLALAVVVTSLVLGWRTRRIWSISTKRGRTTRTTRTDSSWFRSRS